MHHGSHADPVGAHVQGQLRGGSTRHRRGHSVGLDIVSPQNCSDVVGASTMLCSRCVSDQLVFVGMGAVGIRFWPLQSSLGGNAKTATHGRHFGGGDRLVSFGLVKSSRLVRIRTEMCFKR